MNQELMSCFWLSGCFLGLFALGEFFYHVLKVQAEFTRKWSHLGTGILTLLFPVFFSSHGYVLLMCSTFAVLLVLSIKFGFLKSINAVERETVGSICYPISVYIAFVFYQRQDNILFFYLPILILAIADPLAALVGKSWPWKSFSFFGQRKTLAGSFAFVVSAFLVVFFIVYPEWVFANFQWGFMVPWMGLAVWSSFVEAISSKGWDNLTIPLAVIGYMYLFT